MTNMCGHGTVVCSCGIVLMRCRCIAGGNNIIVKTEPCTHSAEKIQEVREGREPNNPDRWIQLPLPFEIEPIGDLWPKDLTICKRCGLDMVEFKHSFNIYNEIECP